MDKELRIDITEIRAAANLGTSRIDAIQDAVRLAFTHNRQVSVIHNGITFKADPAEITSKIELKGTRVD